MGLGVQGWGHPPGIDALRETVDPTITWGGATDAHILWIPMKISSAVRDPGNTPTTVLRAGLLLSVDDATDPNLLVELDVDVLATDNVAAILWNTVDITLYGTAGDLVVPCIVGGPVVSSRLIDPTSGHSNSPGGWVGTAGEDTAVRTALANAGTTPYLGKPPFMLDDFFRLLVA